MIRPSTFQSDFPQFSGLTSSVPSGMMALRDNSSLHARNHISADRLMKTDATNFATSVDVVRKGNLSLSKWVNERFPPWNEILTTHEVARLTRHHRWILSALTLLGRFPRRQLFRGRAIGWLRSDVTECLCRRHGTSHRHSQRPQHSCSRLHYQHRLPLSCTATPVAPDSGVVPATSRTRTRSKAQRIPVDSNGAASNE
jgi:hypothetical protein